MASFDQLVNRFFAQYPSGHIPKEKGARLEALKELLSELKNNGFKRSDFTNTMKAQIRTKCVNQNYKYKSNLKVWKECVVIDFTNAFDYIFTEDAESEPTDYVPEEVVEAVEEQTGAQEESPEEAPEENIPDTTTSVIEEVGNREVMNHPINSHFDPEMVILLGLKVK